MGEMATVSNPSLRCGILGFLRITLAGGMLDKSNGIVWDLACLYSYKISVCEQGASCPLLSRL